MNVQEIADWLEQVNQVPQCSICGHDKPIACWMGQSDIYVCSGCAIEVLPKLLADALPTTKLSQVNDAKLRFDREFWRALYLRKERIAKDQSS